MSEAIVIKKEQGKVKAWMPYDEYIRKEFFFGIAQVIVDARMIWGCSLSPEAIWKVAQERYQELESHGILTPKDLNYYLPPPQKETIHDQP